MSRIEEDNLFW